MYSKSIPLDPVLTLVRGVSGSGKTAFADYIMWSRHWNSNGHVYSADDYFEKDGMYGFDTTKLPEAHQYCQNNVEAVMSTKHRKPDIAVANTFTRDWELKPYQELAEKYGYMVFVVIVENRHGGKNEHGVPDSEIKKMKDRFEVKL